MASPSSTPIRAAAGHSDGTGKLLSKQEAEDSYDLVPWIAEQPWL